MKKAVVVLFVFLSTQVLVVAQVSNPDTMIYKVFAALKAKDEKAFVALYPNAKQFGAFALAMLTAELASGDNQNSADASTKALMDSFVKAQIVAETASGKYAAMEKTYSEEFTKTIGAGEAKGVKWAEAKLVSYTIDSSKVVGEDAKEVMTAKKAGVTKLQGIIDFSVGDSAYQIHYMGMMSASSEGGWFWPSVTAVLRKGELPPPFETEVRSIIVQDVREAPPPPPPPPPKKKVKTKTKSKTKS